MDNRLKLEQFVLKGRRAKECLPLLEEFRQEKMKALWKATAEGDQQTRAAISCIAQTIESFTEYLKSVVGNGLVAERDLEQLEEDNENGQ